MSRSSFSDVPDLQRSYDEAQVLVAYITRELGESPEAWRGAQEVLNITFTCIQHIIERMIELDSPVNTPAEQAWNKWMGGFAVIMRAIHDKAEELMPPGPPEAA